MTIKDVEKGIRTVYDFPKPGIEFKDITTVLSDPLLFACVIDEMDKEYSNKGITKVVGIESRGFVIGGVVARDLGAGFVLARKPGKLPAETFSVSYDLEYGSDTIEIHKDALSSSDIVLIHDDLLATGGTMGAAIELVQKFGVKKIYVNFMVELSFLNGRSKLSQADDITSLIIY